VVLQEGDTGGAGGVFDGVGEVGYLSDFGGDIMRLLRKGVSLGTEVAFTFVTVLMPGCVEEISYHPIDDNVGRSMFVVLEHAVRFLSDHHPHPLHIELPVTAGGYIYQHVKQSRHNIVHPPRVHLREPDLVVASGKDLV